MEKEKLVLNGKPVGKIRASFILFGEAFRFLKADSEMLFIPIITSLINLVLFALLCAIGFVTFMAFNPEGITETTENSPVMYVFLFCSYVISAFTLALSQAGIAHIVYTRAKGGNATLGNGLASAFSHWFSLLLWSVITSTVGIILRMIAERSRMFTMIIVALFGAAWSVLTYFVVPAMVIDKKSAFASIGHSVSVFKNVWGETFVSNISTGIVFFGLSVLTLLTTTALIVVGAVFEITIVVVIAITLGIAGLVFLGLLQAAINGILKTLLYLYASENFVPGNFNRELLGKMLARQGTVMQNVTPIVPHNSVQ